MKLKSLFMFTTVALTVAGCSSDNGPSVNPRLVKPSTYSLSIYATDRANINVYSPKDDAIAVVSDEAAAEFEDLDALKPQAKRPMTAHEYKKMRRPIVPIPISKLLSRKMERLMLEQPLSC